MLAPLKPNPLPHSPGGTTRPDSSSTGPERPRETANGERRRSVRLALASVLALALWLRLDGIGFGLDLGTADNALFTNDVDARGMVQQELQLLVKGDIHPGPFLSRGPAGFLVFALVDTVIVLVQTPFHAHGWSGVLQDLRANPSLLHLAHRLVAALAGVLSVALVFRIVRREIGEVAALMGALILAVAYLHVREGHFATVDSLSGLATFLALDQMLLLIRDPSRTRHAASGLLAGVATGTKYFGAVLGMPLVLAHFLARGQARENGVKEPGAAYLALAVLCCPIGFLLVCPTAPFVMESWIDKVSFNAHRFRPNWSSASLHNIFAFHSRYTLACGLGESALLLALAGFWPLWRRGRAGRFLALVPPLLATALIATRMDSNARYGIPLLVTLAIPAGAALAEAWSRLPRPLAALVTAIAIAPSLARSYAFDRLLNRPDTRIEMFSVLRQRGQSQDEVLAVGDLLDLPVPDNPRVPPYHLYSTKGEARRRGEPAEFLSPPPRTILLSLTTPRDLIPDWPAVEKLLASRYREVLRLEVGEDPVGLFDPNGGTEALKVAYASPWRQSRPGPAMVLYELVEPAPDEARPR